MRLPLLLTCLGLLAAAPHLGHAEEDPEIAAILAEQDAWIQKQMATEDGRKRLQAAVDGGVRREREVLANVAAHGASAATPAARAAEAAAALTAKVKAGQPVPLAQRIWLTRYQRGGFAAAGAPPEVPAPATAPATAAAPARPEPIWTAQDVIDGYENYGKTYQSLSTERQIAELRGLQRQAGRTLTQLAPGPVANQVRMIQGMCARFERRLTGAGR